MMPKIILEHPDTCTILFGKYFDVSWHILENIAFFQKNEGPKKGRFSALVSFSGYFFSNFEIGYPVSGCPRPTPLSVNKLQNICSSQKKISANGLNLADICEFEIFSIFAKKNLKCSSLYICDLSYISFAVNLYSCAS